MTWTPTNAHPTVVHMLADAARQAPRAEAIVDGERRLDYAGLLAAVAGLARSLLAQGVAGQRVILSGSNSLDFAVALYAIHAAGAQAVPVNPGYTPRELEQIATDAAPVLVLHDAATGGAAAEVAARLGIPSAPIGPRDGGGAARQGAGPALPPLPSPGTLATLQYTGGTTGRPKGVDITHGQMAVNVAQREAALPTRPEDETVLCVMPLFHVFATSMCLYLSVNCRGRLVMLPRYRPDRVLDAIARHRVTRLPAGPTIIAGLMQAEGFAAADLSSLRAVYSGSAALPATTLQRWEGAGGCPIFEGYGQSEAGPVLSYQHDGEPRQPGTVGRAVPGTAVEIVDVETGRRVLGPGEQGEIRARGPQIMSGYRDRPQETAAAIRDGWLYTGDIGEMDAAGILTIRDRKKDMVISGGYNVYPREVEEVLHAHPGIAEAAVVGVPDAYRGEILVAYLSPAPGRAPSDEELQEHCKANLAPYKVPARFERMPVLPRTTVGKLDKVALRDLARRAAGTP
jgi:long-chain acyl-CoA synthetase